MNSVLILPEVGSTNSALLDLFDTKAVPNHFALRTHHQTDGKGQQDSHWFFKPGCSLAFSYLYTPERLGAAEAPYLSMAVALALLRYLQTLTEEAAIKWPNDLYIRDQKVCGILIQNQLSGSCIKASIIGIGINVKRTDFPAHLPRAGSLEALCGFRCELDTVFEQLLPYLKASLQQLDSGQLDAIRAQYAQNLYLKGRAHTFKLPCGSPLQASLSEVNPSGELEITTPDDQLLSFKNKEIYFF